MIERIKHLEDFPRLRTIGNLAAMLGSEVYVVGGTVRDILSGRKCEDFDFALQSGEEEIPRSFAAMTGGAFFWLDEARKQSRVVVKSPENLLKYDFAPLRGTAIQDDLVLRDFTVNAMAVRLGDVSGQILDPLDGRGDIERRQIKACSCHSFIDDPLRLLRAVRFAITLGYTIENHTFSSLAEQVPLIAGVAKERVRDEVFKILDAPDVGSSLRLLLMCGLLQKVFPFLSKFDAEAGIRAAQTVEDTTHQLVSRQELQKYLKSSTEAGITFSSLLKLSALIRPSVESSRVARLLDDMRFGKKTKRVVQQLLSDMEAAFIRLASNPAERAMFRLFRDRDTGPETIIAALADGKCERDLAERLIDYFFNRYGLEAEELVSGKDIMDHFKLKEGAHVGNSITLVREAEASGNINSKAEALAFLGKKLLTKPRS